MSPDNTSRGSRKSPELNEGIARAFIKVALGDFRDEIEDPAIAGRA
jgi:hypothetical protein